jgi:hypothetical protein
MDILKSLSEDEIAGHPAPSDDEIRAAIERGAEDCRKFLEAQGRRTSSGRRC